MPDNPTPEELQAVYDLVQKYFKREQDLDRQHLPDKAILYLSFSHMTDFWFEIDDLLGVDHVSQPNR